MTHTRYDRSHLNLNGQLTNTRRSDGDPEPDGGIKAVTRKKILHYRQLYVDRPDPIAFIPVEVDTSDRIYDDFLRLSFLHVHREASASIERHTGRYPTTFVFFALCFYPILRGQWVCFWRKLRP
jgi:hypothetical protein